MKKRLGMDKRRSLSRAGAGVLACLLTLLGAGSAHAKRTDQLADDLIAEIAKEPLFQMSEYKVASATYEEAEGPHDVTFSLTIRDGGLFDRAEWTHYRIRTREMKSVSVNKVQHGCSLTVRSDHGTGILRAESEGKKAFSEMPPEELATVDTATFGLYTCRHAKKLKKKMDTLQRKLRW